MAVINGIILYTGTLNEDTNMSDIILTDVCPFSLGINLIDHSNSFKSGVKFKPIISRNETLPITKTYPIRPAFENQTSVCVKVFQGESLDVDKNLYLGKLELPCKSIGDLILVTFTYDINSILKINVENSALNIKKEIYIHHDNNLSEYNKEKLISELKSIKHLDMRKQRQKYYFEKLNYIFENGNIQNRDMCEEFLERYNTLIASGTYKEVRLLEKEIDMYLDTPINFNLVSNDLIS